MKIVFVVRVHKLNGGRLAFYVPKNVIEFYGLTGKEQILEDSRIKWNGHDELLPDLGTKLYPHVTGIRGVIPLWTNMPDAGTMVELTLKLV